MGSPPTLGWCPARHSNKLALCGFPQNKYKDHVKKHLAQGSYTTLPETRDTIHVKKVTKHVSDVSDAPSDQPPDPWQQLCHLTAKDHRLPFYLHTLSFMILHSYHQYLSVNFELWFKG